MSQQTISLLGKIDISQIEGLEDIMEMVQNSIDMSEIEQEIADNELVISYALNDLNDRIQSLQNTITDDYEITDNKVQSVISNSSNTETYPSTKAIYDEFCRKPVVIWETNGVGLIALETNLSDNPTWQLTDLDFSPYSYVKIYSRAAQKSGSTASASTTAAMVLEMSLDPRSVGPYGSGNPKQYHYVGSVMSQKPNDNNRYATLTCAISADKTSFSVLRMTNLYGTAATDNSDVNAYVYKIVGYYD